MIASAFKERDNLKRLGWTNGPGGGPLCAISYSRKRTTSETARIFSKESDFGKCVAVSFPFGTEATMTLDGVPTNYAGSLSDYAALKNADVALLGYGEFITQAVNFLIVAFIIFSCRPLGQPPDAKED